MPLLCQFQKQQQESSTAWEYLHSRVAMVCCGVLSLSLSWCTISEYSLTAKCQRPLPQSCHKRIHRDAVEAPPFSSIRKRSGSRPERSCKHIRRSHDICIVFGPGIRITELWIMLLTCCCIIFIFFHSRFCPNMGFPCQLGCCQTKHLFEGGSKSIAFLQQKLKQKRQQNCCRHLHAASDSNIKFQWAKSPRQSIVMPKAGLGV